MFLKQIKLAWIESRGKVMCNAIAKSHIGVNSYANELSSKKEEALMDNCIGIDISKASINILSDWAVRSGFTQFILQSRKLTVEKRKLRK